MATDTVNTRTAQIVSQSMVTAGMTKSALSTASGIPYSTLGRSLQGDRSFTIGEICVISRILGRRPVDLLPDDCFQDNLTNHHAA